MTEYYAHSRNASGQRQRMQAHLQAVADRAAQFAGDFGAGELARLLGLWHDVGKFNPAFQQYLFDCEAHPTDHGRGPDHKAAGTHLAIQQQLGLIALLIQGHHGGLKSPEDMKAWLSERLQDGAAVQAIDTAISVIPGLLPPALPALPTTILRDPLAAETFLRMLFSALVDADFLDTEAHFSPERAAQRGSQTDLAALWERLDRHVQCLMAGQFGPIADVRREIYTSCVAAAASPPGVFRLTVPTGGGKTLSGMAFALRHALQHGHRRVIVAVPFISITEQTADVYRSVFEDEEITGRPIVLEHHSGAIDDAPDSDDFHQQRVWRRLAAENWDAPIIVTTTIQLFQSLFAAGTSAGRKNHRLARSIIILDEAQALPAHLLTPILDVLRGLCAHYGTTAVISTATQPAFAEIPAFASIDANEIVPEPARFFEALRRVEYEWRVAEPLSWPEIAGLMRDAPSALAVLNTKANALALLDALDDSDALHLSTLLCGAHRRAVLADVRRRLAAGEPCRLVSTQVVEAGVDVDFPLVLRALGPLDSVIQAAGRCNREGRLHRGRVIVFQPQEGGWPAGFYRTATDITRSLLSGPDADPNDPAFAHLYFQRLFQTLDLDREGIQAKRSSFDFPEVARCFRMIDDDTESLAVPYGDVRQRAETRRILNRLRDGAPDARLLLRRLQPYLVSVRTREADRFRRQGLIGDVTTGLGEWLGRYDDVRGLVAEDRRLDQLVV